jgi:hypothetical protein
VSDKYIVVRKHVIENSPELGAIMERYRGHDYGLVRTEAQGFGEECIALATGEESPLFVVVPLSCVLALPAEKLPEWYVRMNER